MHIFFKGKKFDIGNLVSNEELVEMKNMWEKFVTKEFDRIAPTDNFKHKVDTYAKVNWACIFNNPQDIGKECVIIGATEGFCFVLLKNENGFTLSLYRAEDITPIKISYNPLAI